MINTAGRPIGDQNKHNMAPDLGGRFLFSSSFSGRRRPPSVPLLLLSSAFLLLLFMSTIAFLFLILPNLFNYLASNVPLLYRSLHSWLSPPYLYLIINCIIVSIAATSRFHHPSHDPLLLHASVDDKQQPTATTTPPIITSSYDDDGDDGDDDHDPRRLSTSTAAYAADADLSTAQIQVQQQPADQESAISRSHLLLPLPIRKEHCIEPTASNQRPLLSARFTAQRKSVKASPSEGNRVLLAGGVSKPKRNETLESTWKAITEGRATPLARVHHHHHHHLKKSGTVSMDQEVRSSEEDEEEKEEEGLVTPVKEAVEPVSEEQRRRWSPSRRRKEASSPSHEELNRRVEAFINKFNEEMRLQRQESFNHYLEMVNRGSN